MVQPIDLDSIPNKALDLLKLMRPLQWIKNTFVFTGFIFGGDYHNLDQFLSVLFTAIAFCLISSSVYVFNDILDYEKDINHPTKKHRPIASGKVPPRTATILLITIGLIGLGLGLSVSVNVGLILLLYFFINVLYSYKLKEIVLVDVFCISLGFMLRILSGTIGVGIPPSKWLLLCGMMLTLFLGFAKRRAEITVNNTSGGGHRKVLSNYNSVFLDELITICATGAIITYSLYTMSEVTTQFHNTQRLIVTVPFVTFAIFRYLFLLNHHNLGEDPSLHVVKDPHIVIAIIGWAMTTLYVLNFH